MAKLMGKSFSGKGNLIALIVVSLILSCSLATNVFAQVLYEDFEDGVLDSRISVQTAGTFNFPPGVKEITDFGSAKAFGFGRSSCGSSCFSDYMTTLKIEFSEPTDVSTLSFKEMELYGNWGSGGKLYIDGEPLTGGNINDPSYHDFGRIPYNDGSADTTYRLRNFDIGKHVTVIELKVWDITSASEIFIDDLVVKTFTEGEIIYQPGPGKNDGTDDGGCDAGKDAYFYYCSGGWSGSTVAIFGHPRSACNGCNTKAYIQFDISPLPADVEKVYLGVTHYPHTTYCYSNCSADFYFYPVLDEWNEMSVPSAPPAEGLPVYGPMNISFPNDFGQKEYDITEIYRQWKSGSIPNNGLVIYSPDGSCNNAAVGFAVASSDHADAAKRPYLKVVTTQALLFTDVPDEHWAFKYIQKMRDEGITTGYCDGTYRPSLNVTRQAMAAFIIRALEGEPAADYCDSGSPFTDVPTTSQFCKYIKRMNERGITKGCTATEYCPLSPVTRQAMAAFIIRAVEGEPAADYCDSGSPFTDVPTTSQFCKYIKRMNELGITKGCTATEYCPLNPVTRAAMAAFLARAFLGME